MNNNKANVAPSFFVGIDAGGTKCKAALYNPDGSCIAESVAGPANVFSDYNEAMHNIEAALAELIVSANENDSKQLTTPIKMNQISVCAACAGAETLTNTNNSSPYLSQLHSFQLIGDLEAACLGANQGDECVVIIAGTGSTVGYLEGVNKYSSDASIPQYQMTRYGGHGLMLGDHASGADIGLRAVKTLLKGLDGLHSDELFISEMLDFMQIDKRENVAPILVNRWSKSTPAEFGGLARLVSDLSEQGSKTASELIAEGRQYLLDLLLANKLSDKPLFLIGGLSDIYRDALERELGVKISSPSQSPEYGAYLWAKGTPRLL